MNVRKTIAGTVLTAGLLLGGTTTAALAEGSGSTAPTVTVECRQAAHLLHDLRALDAHLRAQYRRVVRLRDAAAKAGKTEVVKRLDAELAKMRTAHAKLVKRIEAVVAKVREECAPATSSAA
jgi:hypothetical protein